MKFALKVSGLAELAGLVNRLERAANGELQRALTSAVADGADPAVAKIRAAWLGVEVTSSRSGGGSTGLRRRVAAATTSRPIRRGVRIEVNGPAVDPRYGRSLAWLLNDEGRWVHPVFGQEDVSATQRGQNVFEPAAESFGPAWRARLQRVVNETARRIEGGR